MTRYEPADSFETPRFSGVRTFMQLPNNQDLKNADAAIVGAPFDMGASFRAVAGPLVVLAFGEIVSRWPLEDCIY